MAPGKGVDIGTIEATIEPAMAAAGYRLVRVAFTGGGRRATLQVMAERVDDRPMTVDDCAELSRTISALLDIADPIGPSYMLEVSSPGLDRPLLRRQDFERFAGFEAKLEVKEPIAGRKRFRGRLKGVTGDDVTLEVDGEIWRLPLESVIRAKLVLTDELLAAGGAAQPIEEMERR